MRPACGKETAGAPGSAVGGRAVVGQSAAAARAVCRVRAVCRALVVRLLCVCVLPHLPAQVEAWGPCAFKRTAFVHRTC